MQRFGVPNRYYEYMTDFNDFYTEHITKVFTYCKYRIKNYQDAQDITSETFMKFYKAKGITKDNPTGYLFTICAHAVTDYYRRNNHQTSSIECIAAELTDSHDLEVEVQSRLDLLKLVDQLDPLPREVILLRFVSDLEVKTISSIIKKSESATKSILYRGLEDIKTSALAQGVVYA
jgi:RNA polymerase sigma-70 factor (ECF subfamily)